MTNRWTICIWVMMAMPTAIVAGDDQLQRGIALFEMNRLDAARASLDSCYQAMPAGAAAYYLGRISYQRCQFGEAQRWFRRAADHQPLVSDYHLWRGRAAARLGLSAGFLKKPVYAIRTRRALEKAVELDESNTIACHDLIRYYLVAPAFLGGGQQKAMALAERLFEQNNWEGFKAYGAIAVYREDRHEAERVYREALRAYPGEIQFYHALAAVLADAGSLSAAIDVYRTATEKISGHQADIDAHVAAIYRRQGHFQESYDLLLALIGSGDTGTFTATELARTALAGELPPRSAIAALQAVSEPRQGACDQIQLELFYLLGQLHERIGENPAAIRYYQRVLRIDDDHTLAKESLQRLSGDRPE